MSQIVFFILLQSKIFNASNSGICSNGRTRSLSTFLHTSFNIVLILRLGQSSYIAINIVPHPAFVLLRSLIKNHNRFCGLRPSHLLIVKEW